MRMGWNGVRTASKKQRLSFRMNYPWTHSAAQSHKWQWVPNLDNYWTHLGILSNDIQATVNGNKWTNEWTAWKNRTLWHSPTDGHSCSQHLAPGIKRKVAWSAYSPDSVGFNVSIQPSIWVHLRLSRVAVRPQSKQNCLMSALNLFSFQEENENVYEGGSISWSASFCLHKLRLR